MDPDPDLTIVLLGYAGVGKSATGNSILGRVAFESRQSLKPVTTEFREKRGQVCGKQISVVDTPGILGPGSEQQIRTWCQNQLSSSSPCMFLVVVRVGQFTEMVEKAVNLSISILDDIGLKNSFLLFTGGDNLNKSLQDYVLESDRSSLRDLVKKFEGRCLLFNNKAKDKSRREEQVRKLLNEGEKLRSWELPGPKDLSIVLLGNTGVGKSATGNSILGRTAFESKPSFGPVTTEFREKRGRVCGKQISVVDTPGILRPGSEQQIRTWCQNQLSSSSLCMFLVVVRVGRFTEEVEKAVNLSISILGDIGLKNSFLLFTGGDKLTVSLDNYVNQSDGSPLRDLVKTWFEGRCLLFNNKTKDKKLQVQQLLQQGEKLRSWKLPGPKAAGLEKEEEEETVAGVEVKEEEEAGVEEQQHWLGFVPFFIPFFIPFFFPFLVPFILFVMILMRCISSWRTDLRSESDT